MTQKSVLVTGASSGFGKLFVEDFLRDGWRVYVGVRGGEKRFRESFAEELAAHPEWLSLAVPVDLHTDREDSVVQVSQQICRDGGLDVVIHNAGFGLMGALEDQSIAQIRLQMETNFLGAVALTQGLLPALRERKGRIIVISSIAGRAGVPFYAAYNASKFALEGYFEGLSYELMDDGISVCLVEPGAFRSSPAPRMVYMGDRATQEKTRARNERFVANMLAQHKNGGDARVVARKVYRVARSRRVPLRVLVGKDAWGLLFIRALPDFLFRPMFYWGFKRTMLR